MTLTDDELDYVLEQFRLAARSWRGDTAIVVSPRAFLIALKHFEELRSRHEPPTSTDA